MADNPTNGERQGKELAMNTMEDELENEILSLKNTLQTYEDTDPAYMNEEMKKLRHYALYTHLRMEESIGHLLIRNQLAPLESASLSKEIYQQVFSSGTTVAIEVDFARKVELARSCGQIDKTIGSMMHEVNDLRKWFSHPSKYQERLNELNNNRTAYRNALKQLVDSHREMNKIFEKYLPLKNR